MTRNQAALLRAAHDTLYYLSIGDQFNEVKRREKFTETYKRLSEALKAFHDELDLPVRDNENVPTHIRAPGAEKRWNTMTLEDWAGQ